MGFVRSLALCVLAAYCTVDAELRQKLDSDVCENGVECIVLRDCSELYQQWQSSRNSTLVLLNQLMCGFDADAWPMVCCPASLQTKHTTPPPPISIKQVKFNVGVRSNADPLPDRSTCGIQNDDKIYGGNRTRVDEHPWIALLQYDKEGTNRTAYYCHGVIVSPRYIITAAHCVKGNKLSPLWKLTKVRVGEWNVSSVMDCYNGDCNPPVVDIPIEKAEAHELYNASDVNQLNDIAMLRLEREIQFTETVRPICLPSSPDLLRNNFEGYDVELAGWGRSENKTFEDVKLKVRVPVTKGKTCKEKFDTRRVITDRQLCAGGVDGRDSCTGDSGGPAMTQLSGLENWVVVGVVSYGPSPCGSEGWPGVYTRVTSYMDWILSKIRP